MNAPPLLELKGITKRFPGVLALHDVSLAVGQGEVVALIGENGAGKSTLMKILGGVHAADAGTIEFDGRPVTIRNVAEAIALGIGFIHQELNVLDNLDVAGNIFLGREPTWGGGLRLIRRQEMNRLAEPYLRRLGLEVSPRRSLRELSIAQQQMVEIAKALSQNARLLIMDEPTSCLTLSETDRLLAAIKDLRADGVSIIYITHRLGEVQQCADRVVALRDGRNVGSLEGDQIRHDAMVRLMVGRDLQNFYVHPKGAKKPGYFQVRRLRTRAHPRCRISFDAAAGEILGFAGLVGAGRSEMAQAVFGVDTPLEGEVLVEGKPVAIRSPREAMAHGIYLVPEDRRNTGLVTEMTVRENVTLPGLRRYATAGLIRRASEVQVAKRQCATLNVKTPSVEARALNLSGGNQQKLVLAKWLALEPRVLIFDEPTRGIDVGAKAEIYRLMRDLAENGVTLLMISSDMEEVLGVSDRVIVMHEGNIAGILERDQCREEAIMQLAVGKTAESASA
ncbi:MAG TPA: sugar ABC transporter ATP-binding protein [Verrucomicrobiae bacterium]|nr:sugar ABC transporter ATP-binding protein [Verrucomicrobiae bacterium]